MNGSLYLGIDVGAAATKVVVIDSSKRVVSDHVCPSGMDFALASETAVQAALAAKQLDAGDVVRTVSCGYGRKNVARADVTKTEIACHAKGVYYYFPEAVTVVDIGGQDNKIIRVGQDGSLQDFKMNRKCAAGTGAFLEEIARRMDKPVEEMEQLARGSTKTVEIGSFCTVFSATEILALIRKGAKLPDIAKGSFRSVVKRVTEMDPLSGKVVATGGVVAHNPIVQEILSEAIGGEVLCPPKPQLSGALGAALYALELS